MTGGAAMDLAPQPPPPMGPISVRARDLVNQAAQLAATTRPRLPSLPVASALAAVMAAWLFNAAGWSPSGAEALTALCLGSLAATAVLAAGWAAEPEELERWAVRAVGAALASALPLLFG